MTDAGYNLIMEFEGYLSEARPDSKSELYTIGYGATFYPAGWKGLSEQTKVKKGDRLSSKTEARELLTYMVEHVFEPIVNNNVTSTITDHQRDALTSLTFNIGSGNFTSSTLLRMVNENPNNRNIAKEFLVWNKVNKKKSDGLTRRRTAEAALYFDMSNVDVKPDVEVGDGNGNMFTELSNSKEWKMNEFKIIPRKANNWKTLTSGSVHPVVGDILFGFHDGDKSGRHDHVAIYLGVHNGSKYVAEGISVAGENINQTDTKVHIAKIEDSRLGLESDIITHFAHCLKTEIKQYEPPKTDYTLTSDTSDSETTTTTAATQPNLKTKVLGDKYKFTLQMPENNSTIEKNLTDLVTNILEPLQYLCATRRMIGPRPIGKFVVTSGYRTPEYNASVGGSKTSEHLEGRAADISVLPKEWNSYLAQLIYQNKLPYRQLIIESVKSATEDANGNIHLTRPKWIHVSYNPTKSQDYVKYCLESDLSTYYNIKDTSKIIWD